METPDSEIFITGQLDGEPLLTVLRLTGPELYALTAAHDFPPAEPSGGWLKTAVESWLFARRLGRPLPSGRVLDQWRLGFLSATEAAAECRVSPATIYRLTRQKDFPEPTPLGYSRPEIDEWLRKRKEGIPLSDGTFLHAWKPCTHYSRSEVLALLCTSDTQLDRWVKARKFPVPISRGLWDKRQVDNNPLVLEKKTVDAKEELYFDRSADKKAIYTLEEVRNLAPIPNSDMRRYLRHNPPRFPWPIDGTNDWPADEVDAWLADREAGLEIPGENCTLPRLRSKMAERNRKKSSGTDWPETRWEPQKIGRYGSLCVWCTSPGNQVLAENIAFIVPEFAPYCSEEHKRKHAESMAREELEKNPRYSRVSPHYRKDCAFPGCTEMQNDCFNSIYCDSHAELDRHGKLFEKKPEIRVALSWNEQQAYEANERANRRASDSHPSKPRKSKPSISDTTTKSSTPTTDELLAQLDEL